MPTNGIDKNREFYTMGLVKHEDLAVSGVNGAESPFTSRGFIVVAERGKKLKSDGIKYVIVGAEYLRVLDILRKRYPQVTFIPWHGAPKFFTDEVSKIEGRIIPLDIPLEDENPSFVQPDMFPEFSGEENDEDNGMNDTIWVDDIFDEPQGEDIPFDESEKRAIDDIF